MGFNYTRDYWKKAIDFYSQPFRPELITELFEPIKYKNPLCYNCEGGGMISLSNQPKKCGLCGGKGYNTLGKCETLDHFISDCQRAGIELTFNQQIADKYFK